jgi:hypothetical protein
MQPDRPVRPSLEHCHDRDLLAVRVLAVIVALEGVVCSGQYPDLLPSLVARERRDLLDRRLCDDREVATEPSKWGIVPVHMSMSAVHEGHGPSVNGT